MTFWASLRGTNSQVSASTSWSYSLSKAKRQCFRSTEASASFVDLAGSFSSGEDIQKTISLIGRGKLGGSGAQLPKKILAIIYQYFPDTSTNFIEICS